jgi:predicted methyltransferase
MCQQWEFRISRRTAVLFLVTCCLADGQSALDKIKAREEVRERAEHSSAVVAALGLKQGDSVADVGAGYGYFTDLLSKAVGPEGHVYAVDIAEYAIRTLETRVSEDHLTNTVVIRGETDNPKLPSSALDAVLIVDSYHEMVEHQAMLQHIMEALRPGGCLVILEHCDQSRLGEPRDKLVRRHELAPVLAEGELKEAGFHTIETTYPFVQTRQRVPPLSGVGTTSWLMKATKPKSVSGGALAPSSRP